MSSKKPHRGPDPATGAPTFDMIETLLAGFRHTGHRDYTEDLAYLEASADYEARSKALEADPELCKARRAMKAAERAYKSRTRRIELRAESVRRRLLSEGLTPEVLRLAQELVAAAEKTVPPTK